MERCHQGHLSRPRLCRWFQGACTEFLLQGHSVPAAIRMLGQPSSPLEVLRADDHLRNVALGMRSTGLKPSGMSLLLPITRSCSVNGANSASRAQLAGWQPRLAPVLSSVATATYSNQDVS